MIRTTFLALLSLASAVPPVWWNSTESCGVSSYPDAGDGCLVGAGACSLIVGGIEARENEFPYAVALERNEQGVWTYFCGGTLINEDWVLTLATCSVGAGADPTVDMRAVLGAHSASNASPNQVIIGVMDTITHENFDPNIADDNDVGLVKLSSPAPINDFIKPACPPDPANAYAGANCVVAGWGATNRNGAFQDTLRYANVSIGSQSFCVDEILGYVPEGLLCASNEDYSRDTCDGDAGSGLADKIGGQFTVTGIASAGVRCADNKPGIYTRVGDFADWVTAKLEKN